MDRQNVEDIIACLGEERTLFPYYRDRYAFVLLARAARSNPAVRTLRRSAYAPLLEKPLVKDALARCGSGRVSSDTFEFWPEDPRDFLLGLTLWGGTRNRSYHQTSRSGCNLVLQLNLNTGDMARFARLVEHPDWYNNRSHPSCRSDAGRYRETLAWARMDVCFDTDCVLIEEVQSDFVRYVGWNSYTHQDHDAVDAFCRPLMRIWPEAMLCAAIWFVWQELGVRTVYYHTYQTGNALKGLSYCFPPRSLYETLPRKFCMGSTSDVPPFLWRQGSVRRALRRLPEPLFYRIEDPGVGHAGT